jgi:hypothetical protein
MLLSQDPTAKLSTLKGNLTGAIHMALNMKRILSSVIYIMGLVGFAYGQQNNGKFISMWMQLEYNFDLY